MRARSSWILLSSGAILLLIAGCSGPLTQGPSDLRFVQVKLAIYGGTTDALGTRSGPKVLVVTLVSERDLAIDFRKTESHPRVDARTCSPNSAAVRIFAEIPSFGELDPYEYAPELRKEDESVRNSAKGEIYLYHVWFNTKSDRSDEGYRAYDLLRNPRDVCITVEGRPVIGLVGVSTNKVLVPQAAIAAALKAGLP